MRLAAVSESGRQLACDLCHRIVIAPSPRAYGNRYWPAFYFVDKPGRIRHVHFGEGDYDGSGAVFRDLLAAP
jgi:hypothetical protein